MARNGDHPVTLTVGTIGDLSFTSRSEEWWVAQVTAKDGKQYEGQGPSAVTAMVDLTECLASNIL